MRRKQDMILVRWFKEILAAIIGQTRQDDLAIPHEQADKDRKQAGSPAIPGERPDIIHIDAEIMGMGFHQFCPLVATLDVLVVPPDGYLLRIQRDPMLEEARLIVHHVVDAHPVLLSMIKLIPLQV